MNIINRISSVFPFGAKALAEDASVKNAAMKNRETVKAKRRPGGVSLWLKRLGDSEALELASKGARRTAGVLGRRTRPDQLNRDYRRLLHLAQELTYDRSIEKRLFTPSRGRTPLAELDIDSRNRNFGHDYQPVHRVSIDWAMSQLPQKLSDFTFVDFGAGRGRALLLASLYEFRRIIGVEFAAELHDDACMNIAQFPRSLMKCRDVDCVHEDAADFAIPDGKGAYLFNNPFDREVLEDVLENISASYRLQPRRIYLVFVRPLPPHILDRLIDNALIFEPLTQTQSEKMRLNLFSPDTVVIYKTLV